MADDSIYVLCQVSKECLAVLRPHEAMLLFNLSHVRMMYAPYNAVGAAQCPLHGLHAHTEHETLPGPAATQRPKLHRSPAITTAR